jgi:hypothetical protein
MFTYVTNDLGIFVNSSHIFLLIINHGDRAGHAKKISGAELFFHVLLLRHELPTPWQ